MILSGARFDPSKLYKYSSNSLKFKSYYKLFLLKFIRIGCQWWFSSISSFKRASSEYSEIGNRNSVRPSRARMTQQEMTPSPVAPNEDNYIFLGLYYRVDVEALDKWATVTSFMRGSIGYVVQEPEVTDDFKHFLITMYGSNWEKRVLSYQTIIVEQLYALITGYSKLTSRMKRAWLAQFNSWSSSQFPAQIKALAKSGGFLEIE